MCRQVLAELPGIKSHQNLLSETNVFARGQTTLFLVFVCKRTWNGKIKKSPAFCFTFKLNSMNLVTVEVRLNSKDFTRAESMLHTIG